MCEEGVWRHGIQFHIFCTSALDENEYLPSCTGEFTSNRLRVTLNVVVKTKISNTPFTSQNQTS
jgi:hypothetical protein